MIFENLLFQTTRLYHVKDGKKLHIFTSINVFLWLFFVNLLEDFIAKMKINPLIQCCKFSHEIIARAMILGFLSLPIIANAYCTD